MVYAAASHLEQGVRAENEFRAANVASADVGSRTWANPDTVLGKAERVRSLGIGRKAFTSIIKREKLPLSLEGFGRYDNPATDDVMMARYRPTPSTTAVSLGMWGWHDNLRAVDVECHKPITRGLSEYERELCVTLMALVLKLTLPEWAERNAWLGDTMAAGHTRKDVILKRDGRQIRFFAMSSALGLEVAALKQD